MVKTMSEEQVRNAVQLLRDQIECAKACSRVAERFGDTLAMERWEGRKDGLQWVLAEIFKADI